MLLNYLLKKDIFRWLLTLKINCKSQILALCDKLSVDGFTKDNGFLVVLGQRQLVRQKLNVH